MLQCSNNDCEPPRSFARFQTPDANLSEEAARRPPGRRARCPARTAGGARRDGVARKASPPADVRLQAAKPWRRESRRRRQPRKAHAHAVPPPAGFCRRSPKSRFRPRRAEVTTTSTPARDDAARGFDDRAVVGRFRAEEFVQLPQVWLQQINAFLERRFSSAVPEVTSTNLAPSLRAILSHARVEVLRHVGRRLPLATMNFGRECSDSRIPRQFRHSLSLTRGPGSTKRYSAPVASSNTVRSSRVPLRGRRRL